MGVKEGYQETEFGTFPADWDLVPVGDLFTFKNGLNKAKQFFGYGTPIVNYMDVYNHPALRVSMIKGKVDVTPKEQQAYEVLKGDVFFTRTSETVDEIGTAAAILDETASTVFSGFVLRARPSDNSLVDAFKAYCFQPKYFRDQVISRASYTTRALTNGKSLSAAYLAKPSREEQKAIGVALSDIDQLLRELISTIAKKRHLHDAVKRQLLSGERRLPGFDGAWSTRSLGELAEVDPENLPSKTPHDQAFNYVSLEMVSEGTLLGWTEECFGSSPSRARRLLKKNDVLFGTVRPNLKSHLHFQASEDSSMWIASTGFCVLRCKVGQADPSFIFAKLFSREIGVQVEQLIAGSSYPAVTSQDVKKFQVQAPCLDEQIAISAVIGDLEREISALGARRNKLRQLKEAMMHELLSGRTRLTFGEDTND